jgi:hypothetical protein
VASRLKFSLACIVALACVFAARAQQPEDEEKGLPRFRFVGPKIGNRIASVAGIPGDPSTYYAGAGSGWKRWIKRSKPLNISSFRYRWSTVMTSITSNRTGFISI